MNPPGWGRRKPPVEQAQAEPAPPPGDEEFLREALLALRQGDPIPDPSGPMTAMTAQLLDLVRGTADAISSRLAVGERESQHVARLLEATNEGVYVQDSAGTVTFANSAGLRILGFSREAVIGKDAHALFHAEPGGCRFDAVLASALPQAGQMEFRTARGQRLPVDLNIAPVVVDGMVAETICVFEDATARIAREQALAEMLAERERALDAQRDLRQQQTDFVSTISHELRTPLTSVLGYLEMINEGLAGELNDELAGYLAVIERNAKRLLSQVQDLLLVSRIESAAVTANLAPLDLAALISDAVDAVRPQAEAKKMVLDVSVPDALPPVVGDAKHLDQALLNLLSNAVKFTPSGGEVGLTVVAHPEHVEIEVSDTGMGIPDDEQGRLFEKFFRSSISQKQAVQGTGLGLAVVKAIVEEHGGKLAVTSKVGVGTSVAFSLPAARRR